MVSNISRESPTTQLGLSDCNLFALICCSDISIPVYLYPSYSATIPRTEPPVNGSNIVPPFGVNQLYINSHKKGSKI